MAQTLLGLVPSGNYAIIKGDPGDANAKFLRDGMDDGGLKDAVASGKVKIVVFEQNTPNWDTTGALNNMQAALNANNNNIQAVLSENDGMATGAVQALQAVGLTIPISGQDGDAAALNRVALGTQTVSVWKNAFALGETAGSIAEQLCGGTDPTKVTAPSDLPAAATPASLTAVPVHHAGWQHRQLHHPFADSDHQGQPRRRHHGRLGDQGRGLREGHGRQRRRL